MISLLFTTPSYGAEVKNSLNLSLRLNVDRHVFVVFFRFFFGVRPAGEQLQHLLARERVHERPGRLHALHVHAGLRHPAGPHFGLLHPRPPQTAGKKNNKNKGWFTVWDFLS